MKNLDAVFEQQLEALTEAFASKKLLVVGDLMLDHYVWGEVRRISPEAPVPVLEAKSEEYRLGGAANVALNLKALGAEVSILGIVGRDDVALLLNKELEEAGIDAKALVEIAHRKTSLKTRMSAVNQQILRIDYEEKTPLAAGDEQRVLAAFETAVKSCQGVIIEDYNKGLLSADLISSMLSICAKHNLPVSVDPKYHNFMAYQGVNIFKPNYSELLAKLDPQPQSEEEFLRKAEELRLQMQVEHLVVTRGARGLTIFSPDSEAQYLPTYAREVYDVTGAGDTVISVLSLAYICGFGIMEAANLANHAAGVVCGKKGTATASVAEIVASIAELDKTHAQR